ncbi:hypothetical protein RhiTH_005218 [Rhizoctonia solani]
MNNPLEVVVWDLYITRYLTYAAFTILLYDHAMLWGIHVVANVVVVAKNMAEQLPPTEPTPETPSHLIALISYEPIFNICQGSVQSNWVVWLNGILYNAVMIALLMWAWLSTPRNAQTPLMALIVRDGCMYFVAIFSALLFNLLVWKYGRESQLVLPFFVVWSTTTIAISRLLLSMKNVQGPEDWGQQVKIAIPDLELTTIREGGLVGIVSRFSEDDDPLSYQMDRKPVPKMSHIGRYDEHL